jgi:hypothetical protein
MGVPMNAHLVYATTAPSLHLFRGEGWGGVLETHPPLTPPVKKPRGEDRWWVQDVGSVMGVPMNAHLVYATTAPSLPEGSDTILPSSVNIPGLGRGKSLPSILIVAEEREHSGVFRDTTRLLASQFS